MIPLKTPLPGYVKVFFVLGSITLLTYILYIGQDIIIPLLLSAFFTVLLNPIVLFLQRRGVHRVVAISVTVLFVFAAVIALVYFIASQVTTFSEALPMIEMKLQDMLLRSVYWCSQTLNIPDSTILDWYQDLKSGLLGSSIYLSTLATVSNMVVAIFLIPVYVLMMLYYEPLFMQFIQRVFPRNSHATMGEVIIETKSVLQHYLYGLVLEAIMVAVLNSVGLLLIGVEYAVLWGVIGAILNLIPYIGIVIAVIFPALLSMVSSDSYTPAIMVIGLYIVIQFIDNNLIVPKVVASRVKINALVSVVAVLVGGSLWGVSGMFLSIPLTAVIKIIFDRIHVLQPYGYLMGVDMPQSSIVLRDLIRRVRRKPRSKTA